MSMHFAHGFLVTTMLFLALGQFPGGGLHIRTLLRIMRDDIAASLRVQHA